MTIGKTNMKLLKGLTAASSCAVLALFAIGADAQDKGKPKLDANGMPVAWNTRIPRDCVGQSKHLNAHCENCKYKAKSYSYRRKFAGPGHGNRIR